MCQGIETLIGQVSNTRRELEALQVVEGIHQLCKPCGIHHHLLNRQLCLMMEHRIKRRVSLTHMRRNDLDVGVRILIANHIVQRYPAPGAKMPGVIPLSPTEKMFDISMDLIEGRWRNRDVHYGDERVNNWPIAQPQGGCSSNEDRDCSL